MYQIDVPSAAPALPATAPAGMPGYFTDGDLVAGVEPTVVPAEFLNTLMLELLAVVTSAGITPDKAAKNQVALAIQQLIEARAGNYVVDTGAANAYVVALNPPLASYANANGMPVKFRAAHANTAQCTLNAGPGAVPLLRDDGTPLVAGDVQVGAVVEATYDRAANAFLVTSIVLSQLGALARIGIGQGLEDDGVGKLRIKVADGSLRRTDSGLQTSDPITTIAASQGVLANAHGSSLLVTADGVSLAAPASASLWNGFNVSVIAQGGAVTFVPAVADKVNGGQAGQGYTVAQGQSVNLVTDGAGNWWPLFPTTASNGTPKYINAAQVVAAGSYWVDTSAGAFTLTLPPNPAKGMVIELWDGPGTWSSNNLTLGRNGSTIMGSATDLVCDVGAETFSIWFNGSDWRLF